MYHYEEDEEDRLMAEYQRQLLGVRFHLFYAYPRPYGCAFTARHD